MVLFQRAESYPHNTERKHMINGRVCSFFVFLMQKQVEVFTLWPGMVSSHCTPYKIDSAPFRSARLFWLWSRQLHQWDPPQLELYLRSLQWSPSEWLFSSVSADRAGGSQHKPSTAASGRGNICLLRLPLGNTFDTLWAEILHFCEVPHSAPLERFRKKEFEDCCFKTIY